MLEHQLARHVWIAGDDYTIADIATFPWVHSLIGFYGAGERVGIEDFPHLLEALDAFRASGPRDRPDDPGLNRRAA